MDNKYSVYRQIRYNRTYRTLGKVTWLRVLVGVVLLVYVLLLSGLVSQRLAAREQFVLAHKLMISPEWMEKYKPETKAFIEAGVLYQEGKIEEAVLAFENIENFDAAEVMLSRIGLNLASENFEKSDFDEAYSNLISVDYESLLQDEREEYFSLSRALQEYYLTSSGTQAKERSEYLADVLQKIADI